MSWYGGYLTIAHVLFKKTEPKVEKDCFVILIPMLYVLAGMVFLQAHLLQKKKDRPQPVAYL